MSNYDVIESYIIDFTTFNNRDNAIINNNKFVFTGNVIVGINYERIQVEKYNSYKILIKGLTGGIYYYYRNADGVENYIIFNKDGVYDIPVSYKQGTEGIIMGYTCNSTTECTVTQLPTSILKDFSGNKHNAYLYGFKGKLNSGVGIYAQDFKNWNYGSAINNNISTKSYNKFHIVKKKADNWFGFTVGIPKTNYYNQPYKLKFSINKKIDDIKFSIVSTDGNLINTTAYSVYINDGSIIDVPIISEEVFNNKEETNIYYDFGTNKDIEIDVELIADYPNQLCYDGKFYAVAYGLPILTNYTIIADTNPFLKIFKPFIDKAANNYICKINKFLQMIEEENGLIDIETLLGKSIDNLIVSPVQEYPDMLKGVTIGNGKIRIGLPGINKDIVLDANDIETFKQSLVK